MVTSHSNNCIIFLYLGKTSNARAEQIADYQEWLYMVTGPVKNHL